MTLDFKHDFLIDEEITKFADTKCPDPRCGHVITCERREVIRIFDVDTEETVGFRCAWCREKIWQKT